MALLYTTLGPRTDEEVDFILPHEHVFVDLRQGNPPDFAQADPDDVIALMQPELERAAAVGVTALVECTPVGVGRRVDLVKAVSEAANFPVVVPTGIYREPWIPQWAHDASQDELYAWMRNELTEGVENTGVLAAWIKLSAGDDGLTDCETKILRAAARAGAETGAVIGSHTIKGRVVLDQLNIIEAMGYRPDRFIWIHAQAEDDLGLHREVAWRGAFIEYDWIGQQEGSDEFYFERIKAMVDAGFEEQVLLSHDRGWYDAAQPGGGTPRPFTYLSETFLPGLMAYGVEGAAVHQMICTNPFVAFAR